MREPIDPRIVDKIREMEVIGVRSAAEVRRHLNTYVKNELFNGRDPPSEFSRRYYPTDADIRNILYTSRVGERKAEDDQENLELKCKEWQELDPEDFIFYRVTVKSNTKTKFCERKVLILIDLSQKDIKCGFEI